MSKTKARLMIARRATRPDVRMSNIAIRYYRDEVYNRCVFGGED